jgi:hypothetical protein
MCLKKLKDLFNSALSYTVGKIGHQHESKLVYVRVRSSNLLPPPTYSPYLHYRELSTTLEATSYTGLLSYVSVQRTAGNNVNKCPCYTFIRCVIRFHGYTSCAITYYVDGKQIMDPVLSRYQFRQFLPSSSISVYKRAPNALQVFIEIVAATRRMVNLFGRLIWSLILSIRWNM